MGHSSLIDVLAARVKRAPEAIALVDGAEKLDYEALWAAAGDVGSVLVSEGIRPGDLVGVCLPRSGRAVAAVVGIMRAGCAYLPIDPEYPARRCAFMTEDSGIDVIVGAGKPPFETRCHWIDVDTAERRRPAPPRAALSAHDRAYVIYTSGSTGAPKGVCVSHGNVLSLLRATQPLFGFGPDDVWTLYSSLSFDVSVWEMWGALAHGGTLVVVSADQARIPEELLRLMAAERVTVLNQVPSVFEYVVDAYEKEPVAGVAPRYVVFAGEPLRVEPARRWLELHQARPRLVNMYGITETTVHATYKLLSPDDLRDTSATPIGEALSNLEITLWDDHGPTPDGSVGEIFVSGAGVAEGYLNRPELTKARFLEMPDGKRRYRSGDLARVRPDGELEYHGRIDDQVKIRGHRIEPGEVEAVLRGHPEVDEAVVVAGESSLREPLLVAFYHRSPGATGDLGRRDLREWVSAALPRHMVPARFVELASVPRTPSGKVDRARLRAEARG